MSDLMSHLLWLIFSVSWTNNEVHGTECTNQHLSPINLSKDRWRQHAYKSGVKSKTYTKANTSTQSSGALNGQIISHSIREDHCKTRCKTRLQNCCFLPYVTETENHWVTKTSAASLHQDYLRTASAHIQSSCYSTLCSDNFLVSFTVCYRLHLSLSVSVGGEYDWASEACVSVCDCCVCVCVMVCQSIFGACLLKCSLHESWLPT